jgi:uncharacterized protein
MSLQQRIDAPGPKKILACDGGGILGLMSVEILARLEAGLRARRGRPELVLADFFDFACGTSTGAIIAACVSAGMSMDAVRRFYVDSGAQMFDEAALFKRLRYAYDDEPLAATLRTELNRALGYGAHDRPATLGDARLRTLLMMVMRNHNTDSPWFVWNNPRGHYNQRVRPDGTPRLDCNLDLPLWQLVRASTAAPTFFPPEVITFAEGTPREYRFIFVDGGVTTYNNPAFMAFQMATGAPYRLNWSTGARELLIVSVGTGSAPKVRPDLKTRQMHLLHAATSVPGALMNAAAAGWDMACRLLGECRFGAPIDREFGSMSGATGGETGGETGGATGGAANFTGPKLFSYVRYDADVSAEGLAGLDLADLDPEYVQVMDSVEHIEAIQRVGRAYAQRHVSLDHLVDFA